MDYLGILLCGIAAMVLGFVWYGPLFGKKWMHVIGMTQAEMQQTSHKSMTKSYALALVLAFFQAWVLSYFIGAIAAISAMKVAFWVWLAYVPVLASGAMWNNESRKRSWMRFSLQTGYQLVLLAIFAFILSRW